MRAVFVKNSFLSRGDFDCGYKNSKNRFKLILIPQNSKQIKLPKRLKKCYNINTTKQKNSTERVKKCVVK